MRDPLRRLSIKYKLALGFVGLCTIAYGLGGALILQRTRGTFEGEVQKRLEFQGQAYAAALHGRLEMLTRRTEDFASDGHIRELLSQLSAADLSPESQATLRSELIRHLRINKLPLEAAFLDLAVVSLDGAVHVGLDDNAIVNWPTRSATDSSRSMSWIRAPATTPAGDSPGLMIATPVRDLQTGEDIGSLLATVRADAWVAALMRTGDRPRARSAERVSLRLFDNDGAGILVPAHFLDATLDSAAAQDGAVLETFRVDAETVRPPTEIADGAEVFRRRYPIGTDGWESEMSIQTGPARAAISGLRSEFLAVGVVLAMVSLLLFYFPVRFLAQPLIQMRDATRNMRSGDFTARVDDVAEDEIGDLAKSFNLMASAVETRTAALERTAEDLRERQHEVLAQRDRLDRVISAMHADIVLLDSDGEILLCNHPDGALARVVERGAHEGLCTRRISSCGDDSEGTCRACLSGAREGAFSCTLEIDKRILEVESTLVPISNSVGGGQGRMLIARDVTDSVEREAREIHQERLAVLGEVAAVMAHELNNPLASISMFNQMLGTSLAEDSPLQESVEVIGRNTETCKHVIRELLGYSAATDSQVTELDVHDILEDAVRFLRPIAERGSVELVLRLKARRSMVRGDEVQLRQVFVNLIMNAIQAIPASGTVTLTSRDRDGQLVIEVRDTGSGIPAEDREQVFRPFFTTKARGEGTGLGLPTAQRIAEMNGGGIELVESSEHGTMFRVRLLQLAATVGVG